MQNFCPARAYAAPQSEQNPALLDAAPRARRDAPPRRDAPSAAAAAVADSARRDHRPRARPRGRAADVAPGRRAEPVTRREVRPRPGAKVRLLLLLLLLRASHTGRELIPAAAGVAIAARAEKERRLFLRG